MKQFFAISSMVSVALVLALGCDFSGSDSRTGGGPSGPVDGTISVSTTVGGSADTPGTEIDITILGPPDYNLTTVDGTVSVVTAAGVYDVTCPAVLGYTVTGSVAGQTLISGGTLNIICDYTVAAPLFSDDFEDQLTAGWTPDATVLTTIAVPASGGNQPPGNYSLNLAWSGMSNSVSQTLTKINPTYISFYSMNTMDGGFNVIFLEGTTQGIVFQRSYDSTNPMTIYGVSGTSLGNAGQVWVHVEIKNIDWTSHTFDVWINESETVTGVGFQNNISGIDTIKLNSWFRIGGASQFDELVMY